MSIGSLSSRLSGLNSTCRQIQEELSRLKIYRTRIKIFLVQNEKEERIESLSCFIESGFLRFSTGPTGLLLEQMEQFPGGTHDDLPDALAGAVDIAGGKRRRKKSHYKNHRDYKEVSETGRYIRRWRVLPDGTKEA
ncbi:hypothetical protein P7H06_25440 [Paenibacillus larvae]|nr:hypothetical protein [Paenibacillus larvae]MDT2262162.1 hypothetical protein [Paenibacillus larvae]